MIILILFLAPYELMSQATVNATVKYEFKTENEHFKSYICAKF